MVILEFNFGFGNLFDIVGDDIYFVVVDGFEKVFVWYKGEVLLLRLIGGCEVFFGDFVFYIVLNDFEKFFFGFIWV